MGLVVLELKLTEHLKGRGAAPSRTPLCFVVVVALHPFLADKAVAASKVQVIEKKKI